MQHNRPRKTTVLILESKITNSDLDRFWSKVEKTSTCWNWTGSINVRFGYGQFGLNRKVIRAHRFSYQLHNGEIPDGLVINHLCRNRKCVNPEHLEVTTQKQNILSSPITNASIHASKTHCINGHPLSGENIYVWKNKNRMCRTCRRENSLERYHRKMEGIVN